MISKGLYNKTDYSKITIREILSNKMIKVRAVGKQEDIYNVIARTMANKLIENNNIGKLTSFILPVGPRKQYRRFAAICNSEKVSCKNLITINMDEYLDDNKKYLPISHPLSFRGFMKNNFFDVLDKDLKIKPENIYFPDPENCKIIQDLIFELGYVDICFGGIGINGHIAFNEPIEVDSVSEDEYINMESRIVELSRDTLVINSLKYGGHVEIMPRYAITIGLNEIFKANELRFYLEHDWHHPY